MVNPKPSGFSNTKAGKVKILERTKALVDNSAIIITIPFDGVTKENTDLLRKALPKATKASIVKNALMKKALTNTQFEAMNEMIKNENMFFFIPEGEAKASFEAFQKWQKEIKRTEDIHNAKYGAMEGQVYVGKQIQDVANLPTKKELITKIAQGIKAVPTKVGKGIKAVPNKLGRAIAAIKNKLEDEAK